MTLTRPRWYRMKFGFLQLAGDSRYRRSPHAEQLGEEFLGEGEFLHAHPIVGQKHPARAQRSSIECRALQATCWLS